MPFEKEMINQLCWVDNELLLSFKIFLKKNEEIFI